MQSWEAMIETCTWCKGTKQFCPSSATFPVDWDEALLVSKVHNFVVPPNEQVQKVTQGNNLVGEQVVMSEKKPMLSKLCIFSRPGLVFPIIHLDTVFAFSLVWCKTGSQALV